MIHRRCAGITAADGQLRGCLNLRAAAIAHRWPRSAAASRGRRICKPLVVPGVVLRGAAVCARVAPACCGSHIALVVAPDWVARTVRAVARVN
jgi:hypothetical protein